MMMWWCELSHVSQEWVFEAVLGSGSLTGVEGQHGEEPVGEGLCYFRVPLVLFRQDVVETPRLQFSNMPQLP